MERLKMKKTILVVLLANIIAGSAYAKSKDCEDVARQVAAEAVRIFQVNDTQAHCLAMGGMTEFETLAVPAVMPNRYAYRATFNFPCGPQPSEPVVTMMFNSQCKLHSLEMTGHPLE
jgi:hypothetical protein